jgi:hypothetical protein
MFASEGLEMAERDREIGRRAHALVASFCRAGVRPEPTQIWVATARLFAAAPMTLNHGSRQRTACAVAAYFVRFLRPNWRFLGAEVSLGTGRVDLVWELVGERRVIDEVKLGSLGEAIEDKATLAQVDRYRQVGTERWGAQFAGVRLLPLASPGRALFFPPEGVRVPLSDAPVEVR